MRFHPPSLRTWSAAPLIPDGEGIDLRPARLAVGVLSSTLVIAGLLVIITTEEGVWLGLALGLVGWALALTRVFLVRGVRLLAAHVLLRVVLLCSVALAYQVSQPDDRYVIWTAAVVGLIAVVGEPFLKIMLDRAQFVSAHLPGVTEVGRPRQPEASISWTSATVILVGVLLTLLGASPRIWLLVTVIAWAVPAMSGWTALRRLRRVGQARTDLSEAVRSYRPSFVIYAGRQEDASYQVTMWLPYLQRTGHKFIIMTRAPIPALTLAGLTDAPVVYCATVADIEAVLVPSLTTVFYPNAASANGQMVRFSHLTHVHLGHGDSDKATSYSPLHAMYDRIFSAGQAAVDRYAAHGVVIDREQFSIVGRPQLEGVEHASTPISTANEPTILYAPTWRGHVAETRYYSIPHGEKVIAALLARGVTVIFRPHPFNFDIPEDEDVVRRINRMLQADAHKTGREHIWGHRAMDAMSVFDCFNASDAMICDVSSLVSDYLFSEKPFTMYSINSNLEEFIADFPVARAAYLLEPSITNLTVVLDSMLGQDSKASMRSHLRTYYLGDFPDDTYSDIFVREAKHVIEISNQVRDDASEDTETDSQDEGGDSEASTLSSQNDETMQAESLTGDDSITPVARGRSAQSAASISRGEYLGGLPVLAALASASWGLSGGPVWLSIAFAFLALLPITWSGHHRLRKPNVGALGTWVSVRALLSVAITAISIRRTDESNSMVWLMLGSLLLSLVLEAWVRQSRTVRRLRLRRLHTLVYSNPRPPLQGWMFLLGVTPLWIVLVLASLRAPVWMGTAVAIEALTAGFYMVLLEQKLIRDSEVGTEQLRDAIEAYAPEFIVYFASQHGMAYQVGMWMPYFERLGRRFIVVTRYDGSLEPLAALTSSPVVLCRTIKSLEATVVPSARAAFYVNNGLTNTHYIERRELTHIWLNHGDSEKPACFNPVHAIYDKIFTAGQAGIDRYTRHGVHIPEEKFEIVGRPQLSGILPATSPIHTITAPTVLYAPTWVGPYADSKLYSLPMGAQIIESVLTRGCTVIFRAHPLNYQFPAGRAYMKAIWTILEKDRTLSNRDHLWGEAAEHFMDIKDCFNASDAMICDVSAVVTDYLQSQKPFSIVSAEANSAQLVAQAPVATAAYVLAGDLSNLDQVLHNLLDQDPLVEQRAATRNYYLGSPHSDDPATPFLEAVRRHIDAGTPEEQACRADQGH